MKHVMVVGTSEPQDFALSNNGEALNGAGLTVSIEWAAPRPDPLPDVAWLSIGAGTVRVTETGDMAVGRYPFRFRLEDSGGKIGFCPSMEVDPDYWVVVSP